MYYAAKAKPKPKPYPVPVTVDGARPSTGIIEKHEHAEGIQPERKEV
jgi:hypothetical protein